MSQINLTWTDNASDEANVEVERATSSSGPWSKIATLGSNATSYSASGLLKNTTYYFRVRATNSNGASAYSNAASAKTLRK